MDAIRLDIVPIGTDWCLTDSGLRNERFAGVGDAIARAQELAAADRAGNLIVYLWSNGVSRQILPIVPKSGAGEGV